MSSRYSFRGLLYVTVFRRFGAFFWGLLVGYLFDHYCHATIGEAQACAYGHPTPIVIGPDVYYPSYSGGGWILQGASGKTLTIPIISFPTCDVVGPSHQGGELAFQADFYSVIFWAVGISAAFLLFKRAVV